MPKFLVNTNYSYEITDGGLKRRIRPIEFTNYFNQCGGVDTYFGGTFPTRRDHRHHCWNTEDWIGFDNFIAQCISEFLRANGKIPLVELSSGGWEKQFKQSFGKNTWQFISENIDDWKRKEKVSVTDFIQEYNNFCMENNITQNYRTNQQKMNEALAEYCTRHSIAFEKARQVKEMGGNKKYKMFLSEEAPF